MTSGTARPRALGLLVDTTLQGVALGLTALGEPGRPDAGLVWRGEHLTNQGSVLEISGLLAQGLAAAGAAAADLAAVAVSAGPGSFTGIKVGLAFVQGLRLAREGDAPPLPCAALCALEEAVVTLAAKRHAPTLGLLLPATRTHGFYAAVEAGILQPARLVAFEGDEAGAAHLGPAGEAGALCIFTAWPAAQAWCARVFGGERAPELLPPSAVCGAAIYGMSVKSQAIWPQGFGFESPAPRYLRLSTAEEKLASMPKA